MKKLITLLGFVGILACGSYADAVVDPFHGLSPEKEIAYSRDFERLLLDFTVKSDVADTLYALTLKNEGSTRFQYISSLDLWYDANFDGFEGLTLDKKIGEFTWVHQINGWAIKDLDMPIDTEGRRFFVTANLKSFSGSDEDFQVRIHSNSDLNNNGQYDHGDYGIYLENNNEPEIAVNQFNFIEIKDRNDFVGPYIVGDNFTSDKTFGYGDSYVLFGLARDRMNSGLQNFQVQYEVDGEVSSWQSGTLGKQNADGIAELKYELKDIKKDKPYTIRFKLEDTRRNQTIKEFTNVVFEYEAGSPEKVDNSDLEKGKEVEEDVVVPVSNVSIENSRVFVNRDLGIRGTYADNDMYVKVQLRDAENNPIKAKIVKIIATRPTKQFEMMLQTGETGEALWTIESGVDATFTFAVEVDGKTLPQKPQITFVTPDLGGQLMKVKNSSAVYLVKQGKRFVFPNSSIYKSYYKDYSEVATVSAEELQSYQIGTNVTYRPGSLIKLPSLAKVYRVNKNGELNWIPTEVVAKKMYGPAWASLVHDVQDSYFGDYTIGEPITE